MTQRPPVPAIRLRGVRHHNLKNFDLDLPLGRLIVITGLSGSGKSSLAFDTLFAEGQRRYIETFSPYARQFFDRMDKPQVDRIDGIPPAIAIEQRNSVKSTRSTVGTMTELCDYLKLLWPHLAQLHCRQCGRPVRKESPQSIWETLRSTAGPRDSELLITFHLPLSEKLPLAESLALIRKQGYQRLLFDGQIVRIDEAESRLAPHASRLVSLTPIQDCLKPTPAHRPRFIEACEHAYHFGKGKLAIHRISHSPFTLHQSQAFSSGWHCAPCDLDYREPTPALFSFNHPVGACPACKGFGRIISIDYGLAVPDRTKTLAQGVVKPWLTGQSAECQRDLMKFCKASEIPTHVPFEDLPQKLQDWVIHGDPEYGTDEEHEWPRAWYGVKGYFRWLESKAYKMHVRVLLSRYRAYSTCPACAGKRFQPDSLLYRMQSAECGVRNDNADAGPSDAPVRVPPSSITLADFYALSIEEALVTIERLLLPSDAKTLLPGHSALRTPHSAFEIVLNEVRARLGYLVQVGLGYLTLDRPTRTLSGGETERVNLTTCLGTRLVNTLFVLDEPSVGLHPHDTARLVRILQTLRDTGNTVVVVEHEAGVIRAADQIVDLGPGQGEAGGQIVFQGPLRTLLQSKHSLTGQYLSGRKQIEIPPRRPVNVGQAPHRSQSSPDAPSSAAAFALNEAASPFGDKRGAGPTLKITGADRHNLKNLTVEIPLQRFVCLTGVSGSGKTTLVREVLLPALEAELRKAEGRGQKAEGRRQKAEEPADAPDTSLTSDLRPLPSAFCLPPSHLTGHHHLARVVLVDQSPLGKTPRSNPVVYIGAFDDIRDLFAQTDLARQRGLNSSAFSFNSAQGQCGRCRGAGFEKIEMQFLSDVFIRCPECHGRRYRAHILEVKLKGARRPGSGEVISKSVIRNQSARRSSRTKRRDGSLNTDSPITDHWSIADLLEATVDDAIQFLRIFAHLPAGRRAIQSLSLLQEVGLGYLRLGQPINTLSGGESQRLKLVSHLAESAAVDESASAGEKVRKWESGRHGRRPHFPTFSPAHFPPRSDGKPAPSQPRTLFLFDEPTTGLHFDDVRVLLQVFQRLVDAGHSLLVIEHNLDVIKCADWVIDLGPEAGQRGGELVAAGTPEQVAACPPSHTGRALRAEGLGGRSAAFGPLHRSNRNVETMCLPPGER